MVVAERRREGRLDGREAMSKASSALKTSVAASRPDRGPDHCSALGSLGRQKRWKA